jgi:hypothetical protein
MMSCCSFALVRVARRCGCPDGMVALSSPMRELGAFAGFGLSPKLTHGAKGLEHSSPVLTHPAGPTFPLPCDALRWLRSEARGGWDFSHAESFSAGYYA